MPTATKRKNEKRICKYCGKEIDKEIAYSPKRGQYYCSENHYLSALEKKQNKSNHSYKSAEGSDRRAFTDAIQDLYVNKYGWNKKKINWQIIMSQCNKLLKDNPSWTYDTILYIIWYEQEILGKNLICKESNWSPFSLVDYYALEAELYFNECQKVTESASNYTDDIITITKSKSQKIKYKPMEFD